MGYNAVDLSHYILNKCTKDGKPITNLRLQSILYFIQVDFLQRNTVAFYDDVEACTFGAMPISFVFHEYAISGTDRPFIDRIIDEKRDLYPWDISTDIQRENGCWAEVFNGGHGNKQIIPVTLMKVNG